MKVFVCGSLYPATVPDPAEQKRIKDAAKDIGREFGRRGFELVVGTDVEESVDQHVVAGAIEAATQANKRLSIQVYYLSNISPPPFSGLRGNKQVEIAFHPVDSDIWHVAHMKAVEHSDCVFLMAGRTGTLVAGLTSMLHGIPFVPLAAFQGDSQDVWLIAKHDLQRHFFGGLNENDFDQLRAPWETGRASIVADYLCRLISARKRANRVKPLSQVIGLIGVGVGIFGYLSCLWAVAAGSISWGMAMLLLASVSSGIVGAGLAVLTEHDSVPAVTAWQSTVRVLTGVGSGFLAFLLLPCAQLLAEGSVSLQIDGAKLTRYMVIAGVAGAYSGLSARALMRKFIRHTADDVDASAREAG